MTTRSPQLQRYVQAMRAAITDGLQHSVVGAANHLRDSPARAAQRIFSALDKPAASNNVVAQRLPACAYLDSALAAAANAPALAARVAASFAQLEPALAWHHRAGADEVGEPFISGHANTTIIGPGGLEQRDDVWLGINLIAPGVGYPDHRHPPEELYVVLSAGQWRQVDGAWHEPGPGGIVYNPPGIVHAMRPSSGPLLAAWCLWRGD